MAEPNLVNVTSIYGKSKLELLKDDAIDNANASILTTPAEKLIKINSIIVANIDGTNSADASVFITKSGGSPIAIASTIAVPADSTLVVCNKDTGLYLEEGDNIEAGASAASDLTITINYEELS